MESELLENGCLKILLTDQELQAIGLDFFVEGATTPHARAALRQLVRAAGRKAGFTLEGHITVEALPLEGGCLLLVSPAQPTHNHLLPKSEPPLVYFSEDFGDLLSLAECLSPHICASLYTLEKRFYFCYYPTMHKDRSADSVIREFLTPVRGGYAAVSALAEHGKCLAPGDAVMRLRVTAPECHAPEQSDPPH